MLADSAAAADLSRLGSSEWVGSSLLGIHVRHGWCSQRPSGRSHLRRGMLLRLEFEPRPVTLHVQLSLEVALQSLARAVLESHILRARRAGRVATVASGAIAIRQAAALLSISIA